MFGAMEGCSLSTIGMNRLVGFHSVNASKGVRDARLQVAPPRSRSMRSFSSTSSQVYSNLVSSTSSGILFHCGSASSPSSTWIKFDFTLYATLCVHGLESVSMTQAKWRKRSYLIRYTNVSFIAHIALLV
jgi:hypothetical protein